MARTILSKIDQAAVAASRRDDGFGVELINLGQHGRIVSCCLLDGFFGHEPSRVARAEFTAASPQQRLVGLFTIRFCLQDDQSSASSRSRECTNIGLNDLGTTGDLSLAAQRL